MAKSKKREKVNYLEYTFTIFEKYDIWQISFKNPKDGSIIKRSTKLAATSSNLITVKKDIIPSVIEYLTGKIKSFEEDENKDFTVDEWATKFFEAYPNKVRENVFESNLKHYNNHIKPYFGNRKLKSVLPIEIETWQNDLLYNKTYKKGNVFKKYQPLTVKKFRSVFLSIFDSAVKNLKVESNPLRKVEAPKEEGKVTTIEYDDEDEGEIFPFNENEIKIILEKSNRYLKNFFLLMYSSGMRPGEIIALLWKDIDFEKKQIRIYKTIVRGDFAPPKTKASKRDIDMLPLAEKALKAQYELTKNYDFVFINQSKNHFSTHDYIAGRFKKILESNDIQDRKLYNLRHTFASQLVSKGEDILWISKTLGHKDPQTTLMYYSKPIKEDENIRLEKINKIGANFGANIFNNGSKADE
ncbi:MAG: tyrosine-type recombinase/integrase [Arcobacter sp.]|uniref:tyrosine-type recombinase/integrase n=1 Tax=Arcobacter sp. TaxID=1872629 RepID=UPI003D02D2BB